MPDKAFTLYLKRTEAQRRLMRDVRTPFENANMSDWIARLNATKSIRAIDKLMAEFEIADTPEHQSHVL